MEMARMTAALKSTRRTWQEHLGGFTHLRVLDEARLSVGDEVSLFADDLEFTRHRVTAVHGGGTVDLSEALPWPRNTVVTDDFTMNGRCVTVPALLSVEPRAMAASLGVSTDEFLAAVELWAAGPGLRYGLLIDRQAGTVSR